MSRVARNNLNTRRPNETIDLEWVGKPLTICVGFDEHGLVKEVFADHAKIGSDAHALLSDSLVLVSILLQTGSADIRSLAKHLGRESVDPSAPAASVLGYIIEAAARMQIEPTPATESLLDRVSVIARNMARSASAADALLLSAVSEAAAHA